MEGRRAANDDTAGELRPRFCALYVLNLRVHHISPIIAPWLGIIVLPRRARLM